MAGVPDAEHEDLKWTIAQARRIFGPQMNIQAPPNLSDDYPDLIEAGINDWGGVSPVTPDHVNPEAPWPQIAALRAHTAAAGRTLVERLAIYPDWVREPAKWLDPAVIPAVLHASDASGYARADAWSPGIAGVKLDTTRPQGKPSSPIAKILDRALREDELTEQDVVALFEARGADYAAVCEAANELRKRASGEVVRYVVNRNINYTNICSYKCGFCAFSKGRGHEDLRGQPYDIPLEEIQRRVKEAWNRGATEVCMQGGIHPYYTGHTYLNICRAVKEACPEMHVHAFSPLEVTHGARTLGLSLSAFLAELKQAGLGTLPGTAAEILDDEVRAIICADKVNTAQWFEVMREAHALGIRSTTTIMYGHVERPVHWARHLMRLRELQKDTGGFTEFVPLPFVHMESPMYAKGKARKGPTSREAVLMHAVARIALHPYITNIQASWVKLGPEGAKACLDAGVNDLGGTLMNESISRAAGTQHGQEYPPEAMRALIESAGRVPEQRSTLYQRVSREREVASFGAAPLTEVRLGPRPSLKRRPTRTE
jgi:FO synthase